MAGKKQNMAPMWKIWMKNVDLDEPTLFLDHMYWGCSQRECKPNEMLLRYTENVRITNFCWSNRKVTRVGKISRKDGCVVPQHGRTCSKNALKDTANWRTEVEHMFLLVGCARNKRQYPTDLQNQKSFRWMLDREWMVYLLLIYGMW